MRPELRRGKQGRPKMTGKARLAADAMGEGSRILTFIPLPRRPRPALRLPSAFLPFPARGKSRSVRENAETSPGVLGVPSGPAEGGCHCTARRSSDLGRREARAARGRCRVGWPRLPYIQDMKMRDVPLAGKRGLHTHSGGTREWCSLLGE